MNAKIVSAIGAIRQETRFDIISNNLSNSQTVGFKRDIPIFRGVLPHQQNFINYLFKSEKAMSFGQGEFQKTGNEFDLAIDGEGFFKLNTPMGIRYTRAGNFKLDPLKTLTNNDGFPVIGKNGVIKVEGGKIIVETDGTVKVDGNIIDKIDLVSFKDLKAIKKEGNNLFSVENQEERVVEEPKILQGFLESSNVNPIEEMIELMEAFRTFESCMKVIQSQDEMDSKAVNELGRIR